MCVDTGFVVFVVLGFQFGLMLVRQALCHLRHMSSPFYFYFSARVLLLPEGHPWTVDLLQSWDYRITAVCHHVHSIEIGVCVTFCPN
jgi:hypothetical protein